MPFSVHTLLFRECLPRKSWEQLLEMEGHFVAELLGFSISRRRWKEPRGAHVSTNDSTVIFDQSSRTLINLLRLYLLCTIITSSTVYKYICLSVFSISFPLSSDATLGARTFAKENAGRMKESCGNVIFLGYRGQETDHFLTNCPVPLR